MPVELESLQQHANFIAAHAAAAVYFGGAGCAVCRTLEPRVLACLQEEFPQIAVAVVDCDATRDLAAAEMVFSVPVLKVYFSSRETINLARNFSIGQLRAALERPYALFFSGQGAD